MMLEDSDRNIAPTIVVRAVDEAVQYYQKALGAVVIVGGSKPDGSSAYAKLRIGNSNVMVSDERIFGEGLRAGSPPALGGVTAIFELFVDDLDAAFERALSAGGVRLAPTVEPFYGDRVCMFSDPFGHVWSLSTFIDDGGPLCI
jgi:PhnB protein